MMDIYKTPSKEIQEIILANLTYETVIDGLNEYFASEPRNEYITVKMESDDIKQDFALYEAEAWADILISWLRTEHGIFYYPGMEAWYAKMERIPPFTKCMMNEGAMNSLKDLHKRVTGKEAGTNSHTLIADGIKCFVNGKESEIKKLKAELNNLKDTVSKVRRRLNKKLCNDEYEDDLEKLAVIAVNAIEIRDATINNINVIRPYVLAHLKKTLQSRSISFDKKDEKDILKLIDLLALDRDNAWGMKFDLCEENQKLKKEIGAKESGIEDLKEHITLLEADLRKAKKEKEKFLIEVADREEEIEELQKKGADLYLEHRHYIVNSIMNNIRQEASRNGYTLPEKVDGEPLIIERTFHDLVEILKKRETEIRNLTETNCKDIMDYIRQEASRNGFELPEEIDGEPLTIKRVFHDLLEFLRMKETRIKTLNAELATKWTKTSLINWLHQRARHKGVELDDTFLYSDDTQYDWTDIVDSLFDEIVKMRQEIKEVNDQRWKDLRDINKTLGYDGMDGHVDDFAKAVKARAECVKRALGEESDINKLIRDYCTKHDIVAPSRYFSEKACVEYLFSVIDLKQKDRSFTILQDLYRDIFKRQPDGLSAEDIANKILDRVLETEDLLHKSVDSVNKECKATGKQMVEDYKLKLKDYILKDIKEHGYRYDGLQSKSIEEIVDWIITMATLDRSSIALRDIYTTVASPVERRRYNIDDCDVKNVDHMKEYILRRFESLNANIEYSLKKMAELDECHKDLKTLEEQQNLLVKQQLDLIKQNSELATKVGTKDDEISRLKGLINAMNEEVGDM